MNPVKEKGAEPASSRAGSNDVRSSSPQPSPKSILPVGAVSTAQGNREPEKQRDGEPERKRSRELEKQRFRDPHETQDTHEVPPLAACVQTLQQAARIALTDQGFGDPVFKLARAIKAFEVTTKVTLPKKELPMAFAVWWEAAKPGLAEDADFEEYLFTFLEAYEKAKTPLGSNVFQAALQIVNTSMPPTEASRYSSPKLVRLVHLCHSLQSLVGDAAFFLSVRDAARFVGCKNETAAAFLNGLVREGVLTLISKGTPGARRASRFKFNSAKERSAI